jgi:hypothetical protein
VCASGWEVPAASLTLLGMAAIFNLNHPAHVIHFWVIQITLANLLVIVLMVIVFALAILLPFPHHAEESSS